MPLFLKLTGLFIAIMAVVGLLLGLIFKRIINTRL